MNKIMNPKIIGILFLITSNFTTAQTLSTLSGKEIMTKNEHARQVNDFEAHAVLTSGNLDEKGKETRDLKTKQFTFWRKVQPDGIHNSTLTRFHAPAEVRDEGILIIENPSSKNDILLYLPAFKKIRRVESQQQSGSFMGSVFSYSDIATPHVDDFQYKVIREEKCPTEEASDQKCTVIESTPSNDEVRTRTGYQKTISWIRQDNFMGVKAEYYQLDGSLYKTLIASQIKKVDLKNDKWLAHSLQIKNNKNEFTTLDFSKVSVNQGIQDSVFSQQNLQKVK